MRIKELTAAALVATAILVAAPATADTGPQRDLCSGDNCQAQHSVSSEAETPRAYPQEELYTDTPTPNPDGPEFQVWCGTHWQAATRTWQESCADSTGTQHDVVCCSFGCFVWWTNTEVSVITVGSEAQVRCVLAYSPEPDCDFSAPVGTQPYLSWHSAKCASSKGLAQRTVTRQPTPTSGRRSSSSGGPEWC